MSTRPLIGADVSSRGAFPVTYSSEEAKCSALFFCPGTWKRAFPLSLAGHVDESPGYKKRKRKKRLQSGRAASFEMANVFAMPWWVVYAIFSLSRCASLLCRAGDLSANWHFAGSFSTPSAPRDLLFSDALWAPLTFSWWPLFFAGMPGRKGACPASSTRWHWNESFNEHRRVKLMMLEKRHPHAVCALIATPLSFVVRLCHSIFMGWCVDSPASADRSLFPSAAVLLSVFCPFKLY